MAEVLTDDSLSSVGGQESRDVRFLKKDPRDDSLYESRVRVMWADEWDASPASHEPGWDVVRFGLVVSAVRIEFP
jgi:hypothetical protein